MIKLAKKATVIGTINDVNQILANATRTLQNKPQISMLQQRISETKSKIPVEAYNDLLAWTLHTRPIVSGRPNLLQYLTFWHDIYRDQHQWLMLMIARQMWKSNYLAARLAYKMTKFPGSHVLYGTYEKESLNVFSKKFRYELWKASPILSKLIRGSTLGSVTSLETIEDSVAWLITQAGNFTHAEGKSTIEQDWDESQYLSWEYYPKAKEAQAFTRGDFCAAGIGGDEDSEYQKMWNTTDQREWHYNNESIYVDSAGKEWPGQGWRSKLLFDEKNKTGLIWDRYLIDDQILAGYWEPTKDENSSRHGYHISQNMAPWIPLSKADAVNKYGLLPEDSIEGKQQDPNYSQEEFIKNILAGFAKGSVIPFPKTLLYNAYDPHLSLIKNPKDVDYELGNLYVGWDWGGGGRTIGWIYQVTSEDIPQFRLINVKRVLTNNVQEQYDQAAEWMDLYDFKQGVMDAGGGTYQVQQLEKEYGDLLRKFSYLKRPGTPGPKDADEEYTWRSENRWAYDKTWLMERVKTYFSNPHKEGELTIKKIVLPAKDAKEIEWVVDQFANERTEKIKLDAGGFYTRYFTPDKDKKPDDALHAQNYAIVAWDLHRKTKTFRRVLDDNSNKNYQQDN